MIRTLIVDDDALTLELHRSYLERIDGFVVGGECTCLLYTSPSPRD